MQRPRQRHLSHRAASGVVRKIYGGARNPRTGERIFAGWTLGTETSWTTYFVGPAEPRRNEFWKLWVFNDPNWDWRTFDFDRDLAFADTKMAVVNSVDADLRPFKARNGKLLMYHGWADGNVPAADAIEYYERVSTRGGRIRSDRRLFPSLPRSRNGTLLRRRWPEHLRRLERRRAMGRARENARANDSSKVSGTE